MVNNPSIQTKRTTTSDLNLLQHDQNGPRHMTLEIQILAWDRHIHVAGLDQLMGYQPSTLDNWTSKENTYIPTNEEKCTENPLKMTTYYHK